MTEQMAGGMICKVDKSLGLVFGWAIICKEDGKDHFDTQGDHIPESTMMKAALDFMENARTAKEMHRGEAKGEIVFAYTLDTETIKALGMTSKFTGLAIGYRPSSEEILEKFRDGTYTGFSIGGQVDESHDVEDQAA
jgi:hypothetical protein